MKTERSNSFLRDPKEIEDYEMKKKFLIRFNWHTWYHPDNWVRQEWEDEGRDISHAGLTTDEAYKVEKELYDSLPDE